MLASLALIVWNIGTRSPAGLVRDVRAAAGNSRAVAAGISSLFVGAIFAAAATVLLWPAVSDNLDLLIPVEIFVFVVALGVEYLIGNDARALASPPRKRGPES